MRKLFCLLLLLSACGALCAQHTDSSSSSKTSYDSLKQAKKVQFDAAKDSSKQQAKAKAEETREAGKDKLDAGKDKVNKHTDSTARASYKNKGKQAVNGKLAPLSDSSARAANKKKAKQYANKELQPFSDAKNSMSKDAVKNKSKSLGNKITSKVRGVPLLAFSGEVRSESYMATAQNPMMRNEPMYSRLYISPTISILGLPFKANFFLTTENNNTYKSDFFSIRFDANAMRQQAAAEMQKQVDDAKKLDRIRQVDLQKNALESQRYQQELDRMKQQMPELDQMQKEIQQQAEAKAQQEIEKQKQLAEEKMKHAGEEEKKKIEAELKAKSDSIVNSYKEQAGDSLMSKKDKYASPEDSAKMAQYLEMQEKLDQLKMQKQKIDQLRQADSAQLLKKISGVRNPDDLRKLSKERMPGKGFLTSLLAVDRFNIGLVSTQYSEFTLYASPLKGIDIGINRDKWFYDLSAGRTTRQLTGVFSATKPKYDRNIALARVGYGELKGNHISAEYLYAYDPGTDNKSVPMIRNGVLNINARFEPTKGTVLDIDAAQSHYREIYAERQTGFSYLNTENKTLSGFSVDKAYKLKATKKLGDNINIEAGIKQTGAAFRTVGNPFLRRNFREAEFKYEHLFFKKQIKTSLSYKEMRDNITELNTATNRMKGYGIKLSTSFEKYPNLSFSYSPYQQGNNHPDSAYRTNNQFSVTNAILTYKKRYKTVNWSGILSYTHSAMELNGQGTVAYKLINTVHTFQLGSRHTSIISYMSNRTAPAVDSLNSNSWQLTHNYLAAKNMSIGFLGEKTQFQNGAYKMGGGMQITTVLAKNFTLSLLSRYDRIYKLWDLPQADVFTGRMILIWRW